MSTHYQLICGGRDFCDERWMEAHIERMVTLCESRSKEFVVVEGAARGADLLAGSTARSRKLRVVEIPADWERLGKRAGFARNELMASFLLREIRNGASGDVVAFPGGRGTQHMRDHSRSVGLKVFSPKPV